ncbi:polyribonucleotide nucleotidyltransferase [Candidatus Gracilibacteria bacterium]|nr:polyribonucleotide nucleotidyltransferase [Candidatus Gracilibacteria bacterium]
MYNIKTKSVEIGGKMLTFEHGKMAHQTDGAIFCKYGEQAILATAQMGRVREGIDFFPLVVDFEAKYYASGKLKGSRFNKREGRAGDAGTLTARMIDRPMRPLFPKGMMNEVQIICTLLQTDTEHSASATAITAASMAILLSGIPFEKAVGAVRVGMDEAGKFFLDPTFEQIDNGDLDLIVAGSEDSIMMVEAGANLISKEKMVEALEFAHGEIKKICKAQVEFAAEFEIETKEVMIKEESELAESLVNEIISDAVMDEVAGITKKEIKDGLHALEDKVIDACVGQIEEGEVTEKMLKKYVNKKWGESLRRRILEKGERIDGRKTDEVRPIHVEVGILNRLHGSAIFQRGETQALTVLTVGGPGDEEIVDDPDRPEYRKRYIHHYNFPPYSVGEVRMMRFPGRREIGHGMLATRALKYVLPTEEGDQFPYTLRLVSEILSCNGSSSMASVCGSSLSLMDGGVPIKKAIAGIAMGMVMDQETGKYKILSDIQGLEDAGGDMDFKVAGDEAGISALQMDIKVKGLKLEILKEALTQAEVGKKFILGEMNKVISEPRKEMSSFAPRIYTIQIDPSDIAAVIGKGGETIQGMEKDFQVQISISEDGLIMVTALDQEKADGALGRIKEVTYKPQIGDILKVKIRNIMDFGAFAEIAPKKDGLIHISEIADERVEKVEDYLTLGQEVMVKILDIDRQGKVKLSMKAVPKD